MNFSTLAPLQSAFSQPQILKILTLCHVSIYWENIKQDLITDTESQVLLRLFSTTKGLAERLSPYLSPCSVNPLTGNRAAN